MQAPFITPTFWPLAIGRVGEEPGICQDPGDKWHGVVKMPEGRRRGGNPSRPGRPSAPETAPIGWDRRRLDTHAAVPSFCRSTNPSQPAVEQSHGLFAKHDRVVRRSFSSSHRPWSSRTFEARTASAVSPCL